MSVPSTSPPDLLCPQQPPSFTVAGLSPLVTHHSRDLCHAATSFLPTNNPLPSPQKAASGPRDLTPPPPLRTSVVPRTPPSRPPSNPLPLPQKAPLGPKDLLPPNPITTTFSHRNRPNHPIPPLQDLHHAATSSLPTPSNPLPSPQKATPALRTSPLPPGPPSYRDLLPPDPPVTPFLHRRRHLPALGTSSMPRPSSQHPNNHLPSP